MGMVVGGAQDRLTDVELKELMAAFSGEGRGGASVGTMYGTRKSIGT